MFWFLQCFHIVKIWIQVSSIVRLLFYLQYSLESVRGSKLQQMGLELSKSTNADILASLTAVVEFLQGAGQGNLVCQVCRQTIM